MTTQIIDSISVEGFKSIASNQAVKLRPINVVIGPNGAGKSNLIGVFSFLHALREGRLQDYVRRSGGAEQILHFGSKVTSEIVIHVSFLDGQNQYRITLKPTADDSLYVAQETVMFWDKDRYPHPWDDALQPVDGGREAGISDSKLVKTPSWVRARLGSWRIFHVHDTSATSPLRKTAQLHDNEFLRPDGSNLAAFLYLLQQKHEETYDLIRRTVQQVTPFFDDFVLRPDPLNDESIRLAWKHRDSDQYFGSASLSDGTLRFVALATLLLQPVVYRPSVVLVDEPELGLHPYAITLLASLIRQASAQTQVIVSTQSPLLLDHFDPEDVLIADRVDDGTVLTRLDVPNLESWLEDYSLGQLWEKNQLGGRPQRHRT